MTVEDCEAIARECPVGRPRRLVGARRRRRSSYGNNNWQTGIIGTTPDFFIIRDWPIDAGHDVHRRRRAQQRRASRCSARPWSRTCSAPRSPIGQTIRIRNLPFRVVGVLARKGSSAMGSDQDDTIILPGTTVQKKFTSATTTSTFVYISAKSAAEINPAIEEITAAAAPAAPHPARARTTTSSSAPRPSSPAPPRRRAGR